MVQIQIQRCVSNNSPIQSLPPANSLLKKPWHISFKKKKCRLTYFPFEVKWATGSLFSRRGSASTPHFLIWIVCVCVCLCLWISEAKQRLKQGRNVKWDNNTLGVVCKYFLSDSGVTFRSSKKKRRKSWLWWKTTKMATSSGNSQEETNVPCDTCMDEPGKAVKSCLTCLVSFCEDHLRPHLENAKFQSHRLVEPLRHVDVRTCDIHRLPLERFCLTDGCCLCSDCCGQGHRGHATSSLEEARAQIEVWTHLCLQIEN